MIGSVIVKNWPGVRIATGTRLLSRRSTDDDERQQQNGPSPDQKRAQALA